MKKSILILPAMLMSLQLCANEWQLQNLQFITENDGDFREDREYTYGGSLGALFLTNKKNNKAEYISFHFAHQMYTPDDFESADLQVDERPYAGYMYLMSDLSWVDNTTLDSLSFEVGVVGPAAQMEGIQKMIHDLIGSPEPQGWDHQLQNELILQINYEQKNYHNKYLVSQYGFELGNRSIKAFGGVLARWGKNIPKDFGTYNIQSMHDSKILLTSTKQNSQISYYLNFSLKANLIARDIFLDGNTFRNSHSVDKNYATLDIGYGFSCAYENFTFDYLREHSTKKYKTQDKLHSYGSFIFGYYF